MPTAAVGQITITDLKDTVGLVLSKEAVTVAAAPDGTVASLSGVATTATILLGGVDDSANWALTAGTPSGMTGTLSGKTYTVIGVSADTAYVDLTASRTGFASLTKRFSVSKSRQGAVGAAGATGAPGVNGTSPVVVTLSNSAHTVPTDSAGNNGNFSGCATVLNVFNGITNDSANWTVTAAASNLTGTLSGKTYTVTALSADVGYVDLTAARTGYTSQTVRFTVSKSKTGVAGQTPTTYWLVRSASAIKKSVAGAYTPASVTFTGKSQTGTGSPANYSGRFVISTSTDGTTWTAAYTSAADESSKAYTVPANIAAVKVVLYQAGGTSTVLDEEIIPVVVDGATGAQGAQGVQGVAGENFVINYATSELWAADTSNTQALGKYGGHFTVNGDGNQRVWATDPFGRPALTWRTVGNDVASDSDGGWDKSITGLDPEKSYMSVVYVRRLSASTDGKFYHGCGKSGSTVTVDRAASSNPYFANGIDLSSFDTLDWYVSIGFIKANADGSASSTQGGLYKLSTGAKVSAYSDFRMAAGATTQSHRAYMYYSTDPNASLEWWGPGFFEINGNEPKLRDLVGNPEWYNGNIALGSDGTLSGGGGGKVTIGGLGYTGALDANKTSVDAGGALQGVASGAGTVVSNAQIGINASGQLYGAGAGNGTAVSNAQISVDTATGVIGGIGTGAGTAVANSQVAFSARQTWEFRGSAEGWITTNASITANADTITLTATGGNPQLGLVGLNINGATYDKVRVRIRRVAGTGWRGVLFYGTSARSYSESYKKVLLDSVASTSFVVIEFDMANLTTGGTDWKSNTVTNLRLDLGNVTGDAFEIDWISVGKYGHDVDLVLSASSQIVAGTETNGVILDAASKSLQVVTGGNERVRLGNQAAAVNGSAYGFVVKDNSGNVVFDSRNAVGIVGNQAHDNYNLGDSSTNPFWNSNTNGVGNVAIGAFALRGDGLAEASGRSFNVAIGYQALRYTTVGTNIAIGNQAGRGNPAGFSGGDNTVIGYNAMVWGTTAAKNVAVGRGALRDTTSGSENTAVGYLSQSTGTDASRNTSLGNLSLRVATGSDNTSIGHNSGYSLNTGSNNTFVGKDAGYTITAGSGNTFIGYKAYTDANQSNQTIIASGAGVVLKHSGTLLETSHNFSSGGNITATGTVKGGAITVEGSGPMIRLLDTDATQSNFWIHANSSKFYVLTDYNYDGSWEAPNPLVLDNATTTANIYGQKAWTAGNDGAGSGLDADTLDGYQAGMTNVASTVAVRDGSGDIHTRLIRSEYGNDNSISGALAYRVESTSGGNNYVRFCSDKAAIKAYLGVVERDAFGGYYPPTSGRNIDDASAGDVGLYSKNGGGTWPSNLVSEFAWVETQKMYTGNASVQHAVEYTGTGTPTGEQWFRTRSNAAAPYVWSTWKRVVTDGNIHAVLNNPKNGDWFNGGYMSIRSDGVVNVGKYLDWHNTGADTTYAGRTTVDSTGLLTHSAGLKVKGTGGLGYAFGGVVTQLTSRDTGVTLNTPSGRITLASVAVTQGTLNKFTLTNSCIAATDVVMVCMQNSGTGRYNVFVDRVAAGSCDIRLQNQATTASGSCSINFVIIKGSDS